MWRASCVDSLFPLLLCCSPCSDTSPSPSPKFPSFRAGSEVRDCDPPSGWVKDSPTSRNPPWEMGLLPSPSPSLYFVYTWPPFSFSLGSPDNVQKEPPSPVSASILDCSQRSIRAPVPDVWSRCADRRRKKKKKKNGKECETLEKAQLQVRGINFSQPCPCGWGNTFVWCPNVFTSNPKAVKRSFLKGAFETITWFGGNSAQMKWSLRCNPRQCLTVWLWAHASMCFDADYRHLPSPSAHNL